MAKKPVEHSNMNTKPVAEENQTTIPVLDGLRGFSCLLVLICHSSQIKLFPYMFYAGSCGVKLFFVLSGFFMGYHYFPGALSIRYWCAFWVRRLFRVYPAYAAAMITLWALHEFNIQLPLYEGFDTHRLLMRLMLEGKIMTYWSIMLEIKFYLVFPLIALPFLLFPYLRKHMFVILTVVWVAALFFIEDTYDNYKLWEKIPCFIGGLWLALFLPRAQRKCYVPHPFWNALMCICMALLALIIVMPFNYNASPFLRLLREDRIITLLCTVIVLCTAAGTGYVRSIWSNPAIRFVGLISYSLYVTHRIVFGLSILLPPLNIWLSLLLVLIEFLVAWLVYRWLEKPFIYLGKRWSKLIMGGEERHPASRAAT